MQIFPNSRFPCRLFFTFWFFTFCVRSGEAFFCPEPPQAPPANTIEGQVLSVKTGGESYQIPLNGIRVWVDGTSEFTVCNTQGEFLLKRVEYDIIKLRFEYFGQTEYLEVGEVGWGQVIRIGGIVLGGSRVEYQTLEIDENKEK